MVVIDFCAKKKVLGVDCPALRLGLRLSETDGWVLALSSALSTYGVALAWRLRQLTDRSVEDCGPPAVFFRRASEAALSSSLGVEVSMAAGGGGLRDAKGFGNAQHKLSILRGLAPSLDLRSYQEVGVQGRSKQGGNGIHPNPGHVEKLLRFWGVEALSLASELRAFVLPLEGFFKGRADQLALVA